MRKTIRIREDTKAATYPLVTSHLGLRVPQLSWYRAPAVNPRSIIEFSETMRHQMVKSIALSPGTSILAVPAPPASYLFLSISDLVGAAAPHLIAQARVVMGTFFLGQLRPLQWFAPLFPTRVRTND
jgi:hypothetical protein